MPKLIYHLCRLQQQFNIFKCSIHWSASFLVELHFLVNWVEIFSMTSLVMIQRKYLLIWFVSYSVAVCVCLYVCVVMIGNQIIFLKWWRLSMKPYSIHIFCRKKNDKSTTYSRKVQQDRNEKLKNRKKEAKKSKSGKLQVVNFANACICSVQCTASGCNSAWLSFQCSSHSRQKYSDYWSNVISFHFIGWFLLAVKKKKANTYSKSNSKYHRQSWTTWKW